MAKRYKVKVELDFSNGTIIDYSGIEWDNYEDAKEELAFAQDSPIFAGDVFFIDTLAED